MEIDCIDMEELPAMKWSTTATAPIAITAELVVFDHQVGTNDTNQILELTNARKPNSKPQHVVVL